MHVDPILDQIVETLRTKHGCHTIILYGSRARGDFTSTSDYDVLGVSPHVKEVTRIAKKVKGHYWDVFIYPEKTLKTPNETHLYMRDGIVLVEKARFGTKLIQKLKKIDRAGPKKLPSWEVELRATWYEKSFERSFAKDAEGSFRRLSLVTTLLEDYFALRRRWYRGSKESLAWLKTNDRSAYRLFSHALRSPQKDAVVKKLIKYVISK